MSDDATSRLPDINGGDLFNRYQATAHLMEAAHDWMRIFRDLSAPTDVREQAKAYAEAVRAEGNLPESAA